MTTTDRPANTLSPERLAEIFRDRLGDRVVDAAVAYGQLTLTVEPAALLDAARMCKEDDELAFDFWEFNSGVDLGEEGFALVTHLYSTRHRHHINLRIVCPGGRDAPTAPSLTSLYQGANWSERETFDMFGIEFEGHPQLLPRILTVENFEGWPLRKDFLLSTREAKPWPGAKEPEERVSDTAGEKAAKMPQTAGEPMSAEEKAAAAKDKAERAKRKAAEMRKKKARERAAAEQPPAGGDQGERAAAEQPPAGGDQGERAAAEQEHADPGAVHGPEPAGGGAPGHERGKPAEADEREPQAGEVEPEGAVVSQQEAEATPQQPDAAVVPEAATATDEPAEGEAEDERAAAPAAAGDDVPAGTPDPSSPEGAAELAGSDIAKDAAAGAVQGDTAAGAPGDHPGTDQPVDDLEHEVKAGTGGAPAPSGAPGIEAEGRHAGADEQSGAKPAAETPGMTAEPAGLAARGQQEPPAPSPDEDVENRPAPSATQGEPSASGGDDADVPVEPAPGADAATLPTDKPIEETDKEAGLDEGKPERSSPTERAQPKETFEGGGRVSTEPPPSEPNPDVGPGSEGMGLTEEQREEGERGSAGGGRERVSPEDEAPRGGEST